MCRDISIVLLETPAGGGRRMLDQLEGFFLGHSSQICYCAALEMIIQWSVKIDPNCKLWTAAEKQSFSHLGDEALMYNCQSEFQA